VKPSAVWHCVALRPGPAPYSTQVQQRGRPGTTPRDCRRTATCPNNPERPYRREFASRGSGVQIPSAPRRSRADCGGCLTLKRQDHVMPWATHRTPKARALLRNIEPGTALECDASKGHGARFPLVDRLDSRECRRRGPARPEADGRCRDGVSPHFGSSVSWAI